MIPNDLEHSIRPYRARNRSYRRFFEKFLHLNGGCYLLHVANQDLRAIMQREIEWGARQAGPQEDFAIGWTTSVTSGDQPETYQLTGIHLAKDDAWRIVHDMPGFLALVQRQTVIGAHRVIVDYCFDLLLELMSAQLVEIAPKQHQRIVRRRSNLRELIEVLRSAELPLSRDEITERKLHILALTRNILEHEDGIVNAEMADFASDPAIILGQPLPIAGYVGNVLELVDYVVHDLNRRILLRWPHLDAS